MDKIEQFLEKKSHRLALGLLIFSGLVYFWAKNMETYESSEDNIKPPASSTN